MILNVIGGLLVGAVFIGLVWHAMTRSDEPMKLLSRWLMTFVMVGAMLKFSVPLITTDGGAATVGTGVLIIAACGIIIGIAWAPSWTEIALKPLTGAFDGGDLEVDPAAVYSHAEAKRKKGKFFEAIAEIEKQFAKFPEDARGLLLMAEIYACDLRDLAAAQRVIDRLCAAHPKAPAQATGALTALADWYVASGNVAAARDNLRRVTQLYPATSYSTLAAQRIAHLDETERTLQERTRVISLNRDNLNVTHSPEAETDSPASIAARYVAHLEEHPLDIDTRQKLAILYASDFQRLDLAQLEFEHLIAQPNQSPKQIAQHLNLLADWQVKAGQGEAAQQTLQRLITSFPKTGFANSAQMRIANLGSELRGQQKSQATIKLGSYEKDLGLKRNH